MRQLDLFAGSGIELSNENLGTANKPNTLDLLGYSPEANAAIDDYLVIF